MTEKVYPFSLGKWECRVLSDGDGTRPVTSLLKDVPPEDLARALTAAGDAPDVWNQGFNVLTMTNGRQRILFDAGFGHHPGRPQGELSASMEMAGIAPADVDCVVITHGDPDHIFGLINADGTLHYPGARYFLSAEAWEWYTSDETLEGMQPEAAAIYRKLMPQLRTRLDTVKESREIRPGIRMVKAPGHRAGHMMVEISSDGETVLHAADALPHPIFIGHPDWLAAIDWQGEMAAATRRKIFDWATEKNALVFAAHLPFPGLGRITRKGDGWEWERVDADRA